MDKIINIHIYLFNHAMLMLDQLFYNNPTTDIYIYIGLLEAIITLPESVLLIFVAIRGWKITSEFDDQPPTLDLLPLQKPRHLLLLSQFGS